MKHIFIVNPISGKSDATVYLIPQIHQMARAQGLDYEIQITEKIGHATLLAEQYGKTGDAVRLYACGGDGTLNEVLKGAYRYPNAEVASVPCGSGNDFVRCFGSAADFLNLADNSSGTAIPIDLIAVNDAVSAAICSVGIDSEVAYGIPKFRRIPLCGEKTAYNLSIVQCLLRPIGRKMRVTIDDAVIEDDFLIATICNGKSYGGGYRASPNADLQDGILEVILVKKMSRFRIATMLSFYKNGLHIENEAVIPKMQDIMTYHKARKVTIELTDGRPAIINIDGECTRVDRLCAEVMPLAARFVLPASLYAAFAGKKYAKSSE
ncbi:MAG: diacylglycerol kinase family protein [Ruthenibacterium sp.]